MTQQDGKPVFSGNLIDHTMASCATVEEVIVLLQGYDLRFLENAMLMFADSSGDSVIVEGDQFVRKQGDFQVVTNFYQSRTTPDRYTCPRYAAAMRTLERGKATDLELCLEALAASKQTGRAQTLYSNVFDLKRGVLHLYLFHDFEHGVTLDLAEELAKGGRTVDLPSLFGETEAYDAYVAEREAQIAREAEQRAGEDPAPEVLDEYTGRYRFSVPGREPVQCEIRREGARLVAETEGRDPVRLYPESSDRFFYVDFTATHSMRFERGPDGAVGGLTLETQGQTFRAERADE
jgi:hypothetical protein